jgi:DNA-binding transcriptional MerR regulator
MIQNYIRDGLLPSPINQRFYTHKHLAALTIIGYLKGVYDIPTIKKVLLPLMDEEGLPLDKYRELMRKLEEVSDLWKKHIWSEGLPPFVLMAHAADIKNLSLEMMG